MSAPTPNPIEIKLHQKSRILEVAFEDGRRYQLPCEYLRVFSPSAEVRGHSRGQETLQVGKEDVTIAEIRPVGNYGIAPRFSDGHDSGIYTWEYLYELGIRQQELWSEYLRKLEAAGHTRRT